MKPTFYRGWDAALMLAVKDPANSAPELGERWLDAEAMARVYDADKEPEKAQEAREERDAIALHALRILRASYGLAMSSGSRSKKAMNLLSGSTISEEALNNYWHPVAVRANRIDGLMLRGIDSDNDKPVNVADIMFASMAGRTVNDSANTAVYRPDFTVPICLVDGELVRNAYVPPRWALVDLPPAEAPTVLQDYLQTLIPEAEAREWFIRALGFKLKNPTFVLPGAVFYAEDEGYGRGTLGAFLSALVGSENYMQLKASIFDPDGDGKYDSWRGECVVAFVGEGHDATGDLRGAKARRALALMKEIFDPGAEEKALRGMYANGKKARAMAWTIVATNDADAFRFSDSDRRLMVARNEPTSEAQQRALRALIADPEGLAGAAAWLMSQAFTSAKEALARPPMTETKRDMALQAGDPLVNALRRAISSGLLPAAVISLPQAEKAIDLMLGETGTRPDKVTDKEIAKAFGKVCGGKSQQLIVRPRNRAPEPGTPPKSSRVLIRPAPATSDREAWVAAIGGDRTRSKQQTDDINRELDRNDKALFDFLHSEVVREAEASGKLTSLPARSVSSSEVRTPSAEPIDPLS